MGLEERLMETFARGITTTDRQLERSDSYRKTLRSVADVEEINFRQRLRADYASFVRVLINTNANLKYKKVNEEERDFDEGVTANVALIWRDENLEWIKVYPSAYPAVLTVYSSTYSPHKPTR